VHLHLHLHVPPTIPLSLSLLAYPTAHHSSTVTFPPKDEITVTEYA
jgi:hypothetical protein